MFLTIKNIHDEFNPAFKNSFMKIKDDRKCIIENQNNFRLNMKSSFKKPEEVNLISCRSPLYKAKPISYLTVAIQ
jgi:hypothetical protein